MSLARGLIIKSGRPTLPRFRDRPISTVTVTPPVVDTYYEVLPFTSDLLGLYLTFVQSNTGVAAEHIDFQVRADGTLYNGGNVLAASGTLYYVYLDETVDQLLTSVNRLGMKAGFPWSAQVMYIVVRQRSGVGAGASLTASVRYEQL